MPTVDQVGVRNRVAFEVFVRVMAPAVIGMIGLESGDWTFMIRPCPRAIIAGRKSFVSAVSAVTFTRNWSAHAEGSVLIGFEDDVTFCR